MKISIKILKNGVKIFKKCQIFHENEGILPKNSKIFPFFKHFSKIFIIFAIFSSFFLKISIFSKIFLKYSIFLLIFGKISLKIWFFNQNIENLLIIYTELYKCIDNFGNLLKIGKILEICLLGHYYSKNMEDMITIGNNTYFQIPRNRKLQFDIWRNTIIQ